MSMNMDYHQIYGMESAGTYGAFGLKLMVASTLLTDWDNDSIRDAAYRAKDLIEEAVMKVAIASDPDAKARAAKERKDLTGLFPQGCFIEEIPNGYCGRYCCAHLPWFVVTTSVGRIKIGWRKRVIAIDWNETRGTKTSSELFPSEQVTKDERGIHAWELEKAKGYVGAILSGEPLPT